MAEEKTLQTTEEDNEGGEEEVQEEEKEEDEADEADETSDDDSSEGDDDSSTDDDDDGDDTVKIKKSELEKMKNDNKRYKKIVRKNRKDRKNKSSTGDDDKNLGQDKFVTKKEFFASNEKKAIKIATTPLGADSETLKSRKREINDNWQAILPHFNQSASRETPEEIIEAIFDARSVWKRRTGGTKKKDGDDKDRDGRRVLGEDRGTGGSAGDTKIKKSGRRILKTGESMGDWYKTDRAKNKESETTDRETKRNIIG